MAEHIEKERIQNLDIARTFAIICVVLCHSVEMAYLGIKYEQLSNVSQIFRVIFFTIGRMGVPIFLLLTGALTLKKQIENDDDVSKFYKKNLIPLFITIEIWNVLYNIYLASVNKYFSIEKFIKDILFLKQVNLPNMWYMPMILGMYLAIPFIAKIIKTFSIKTIKIPMIIVFINAVVLPSANEVFKIWKLQVGQMIINLSFLGGVYGLYIILGYYIKDGLLKKYKDIFLAIIASVSFIHVCVFQYITFKVGKGYNVWYNFITLFICTVCIFELFTRIKNRDNKKYLVKLSKYISKISLGIFFVHEIFVKIFVKYTAKLSISNPLESIILFVGTTVCSIIFINLMSRIKFIREKVFLIKD